MDAGGAVVGDRGISMLEGRDESGTGNPPLSTVSSTVC